jgi:hypothetical protein
MLVASGPFLIGAQPAVGGGSMAAWWGDCQSWQASSGVDRKGPYSRLGANSQTHAQGWDSISVAASPDSYRPLTGKGANPGRLKIALDNGADGSSLATRCKNGRIRQQRTCVLSEQIRTRGSIGASKPGDVTNSLLPPQFHKPLSLNDTSQTSIVRPRSSLQVQCLLLLFCGNRGGRFGRLLLSRSISEPLWTMIRPLLMQPSPHGSLAPEAPCVVSESWRLPSHIRADRGESNSRRDVEPPRVQMQEQAQRHTGRWVMSTRRGPRLAHNVLFLDGFLQSSGAVGGLGRGMA